jgi:hypothetical protein
LSSKSVPVVYLDSRDYSLMSDPRCTDSSCIEARDRLFALVAASRVHLPYSWAHVGEMSLDRSASPNAALARLRLMEKLANGQSLRHPAGIVSLEAGSTGPEDRYELGTWHPDPDGVRHQVETVVAGLKVFLESRTTEHRAAIYSLATDSSVSPVMPQPLAAVSIFSEDTMRNLLRLILDADMPGAIDLYLSNLTLPSSLCEVSAARGHPSGVAENFEYHRDRLVQILHLGRERWKQFAYNSEFVKRFRNLPSNDLVPMFVQQLVPGLCVSDAQRLHGAIFAVKVMAQLYRDAAATGRKILSSDGGDILHSFYLPYVDAFSCDGHMVQVLNRIRPTARILSGVPAQIAASIEDLVDAHERS